MIFPILTLTSEFTSIPHFQEQNKILTPNEFNDCKM